MNNVIFLKEDNLFDYFWCKELVVVYTNPSCSSCKSIIPHLYQIEEKYKIIVVNSDIHMESNKFFPGGLYFYPTIAYFKDGKFVAIIEQDSLINKNLW